jgi:hypothetical protein
VIIVVQLSYSCCTRTCFAYAVVLIASLLSSTFNTFGNGKLFFDSLWGGVSHRKEGVILIVAHSPPQELRQKLTKFLSYQNSINLDSFSHSMFHKTFLRLFRFEVFMNRNTEHSLIRQQ